MQAAGSSTAAVSEAVVKAALAEVSPAERVLVEGLQADYAAYKARMAALDAKTLATNVLSRARPSATATPSSRPLRCRRPSPGSETS